MLNTLPVDDPAMSRREREEVFRRYRAFAGRVNARNRDRLEMTDDRSYIEAIDGPDGPIVMNFATLEVLRLPPRVDWSPGTLTAENPGL
jgi:hypothetical protein